MEESKQILIAITELQSDMKYMREQINEISAISKLASQTQESAKSAHNRLTDMKADFERKLADQKVDYEEKLRVEKESRQELQANITWLWRTVGGGAIGLVFSVIFYLFQKFGG